MNFLAVKMESTELPHDLETQDVFDSDKELIDLYVKFNYEDPNTQKQEKVSAVSGHVCTLTLTTLLQVGIRLP